MEGIGLASLQSTRPVPSAITLPDPAGMTTNGKLRPITMIVACAIALIGLTCRRPSKLQPLKRAFYYWHTTFQSSPELRQYLKEQQCKHLYLKVADIGLDAGSGRVVPYARLQVADSSFLNGVDCTPVVFITNEVFLNTSNDRLRELAEKVAQLMRNSLEAPIVEWQIDCDWTNRSQKAFFSFLQYLRSHMQEGERLSATIRLHQFKFPRQTGVPPVDRGMLMCYNTGDIDAPDAENSIFDLDEARKYLQGGSGAYPLPLDVVLPVFEWNLVYRNDVLWKIIPGRHPELFPGVLKAGTFVGGHYLRPGDLIRRETISADLLREAVHLLPPRSLANDATLAFFSLEEDTPEDYPASLLNALCQTLDSLRAVR